MKKGHERLLRLHSHLLTVPDNVVDLDSWFSQAPGQPVPDKVDHAYPLCGTVACAVGHAMTLPEFNAEGFYGVVVRFPALVPQYIQPGDITGTQSWDAVEKFFEIEFDVAEGLFAYSLQDLHDEDQEDEPDPDMFQHLDEDVDLNKLTDRTLVLMRMRNYLLEVGAITAGQAAQMRAKERA